MGIGDSAEEIEKIRAEEDRVRGQRILEAQGRKVIGDQVFGLFGNGGAFIQKMPVFLLQGSCTPSLNTAYFCVKLTFERFLDRQEFAKMSPRQL